MISIFKRALCIALVAVAAFSLTACSYHYNDVHTPYDDLSDLGDYITLGEYSIEIARADVKEMVEAEVNSFIRSEATERLIGDTTNNVPNRAVQKGDDVTVSTTIRVYDENGELKDFDSTLDIEEGDTTTTANLSNYVIEDVGNGNFLREIEDALQDNCWTGTHKFIDVQYDDKVQTEELKNKKVQIELVVHKIVEVIKPEYCDAFIAAKTAYSTVAEFEAELEKELLRAYVWAKYVEKCTMLKYPEDRITKFQNEFKNYHELTAKDKGKTLEAYIISLGSNMSNFANEMQAYAQGTIKEEMALYYVAELEDLSFTEEEYNEYAVQMAKDYGCEDVATLEATYTKELVERNFYWDKVKDFLYNEIVYID